ncbi:MAG: T9SS type A sorting domain-containing protein [Paludibacteraceae bacterium]|nr:T9SS type A sorting domain-containing protein [Paludibacteraceae bacterium]
MKKLLSLLILSLFAVGLFAQSQEANLEKYWNYRKRLREKFIVVTPNVSDFGVNIPAASIENNVAWWSDANCNMSHYLTVLATELWLLKNNKQDYSQTLAELLYAMLALERLDVYSESILRWKAACGETFIEDEYWQKYFVQPGDINGFMIRDDVSQVLKDNYPDNLDVPYSMGKLHYNDTKRFEENSQDVIIHDMEALALVSKLVGTESIANIPCYWSDLYFHLIPYLTGKNIVTLGTDVYSSPVSVNFSLWAKDIVKRFIDYIQYPGTYNKGIGFNITTSVGSITFNTSFFSTHWILVNPVTNHWVLEGSGTDGGVAMASSGFIRAGLAITGENLQEYNGLFSDNLYDYGFRHPISKINGKYLDDNLTRSLACNGNILGDETFDVLRSLRDEHDLYDSGQFPNNEHLPLINLVLHDPDYNVMKLQDNTYNTDKILYEDLLNSAPANGPASNLADNIRWTSASRCIWSWKLGKTLDSQLEYNGLDYMMLHNLYYIAFRKEDLKTIIITDKVEMGVPLEPQYYDWINKRSTSQRAGFIETNSSILGNNVTYTATRGITLKKGFSASGTGGKKFVAKAAPLPNNYQGGLYKLPATSQNTSGPAYAKKSNNNESISEKTTTNDNNLLRNEITISPNPSRVYVKISIANISTAVDFDIVSSNSVVVFSGKLHSTENGVNLSGLPKGIYFARLYLDKKIEIKKIILL